MQRVIPFPDTTATVRCVEIDGKLYASPFDYVQIFCKDPIHDSKEKISKNAYYIVNKYVDMESLSPWSTLHRFEGIGQHGKMVLTLEGMLKMSEKLPCYLGETYSATVLQVLTRYLSREENLVDVPILPRRMPQREMFKSGSVRITKDQPPLLNAVDVVAFVKKVDDIRRAAKYLRDKAPPTLQFTERKATCGRRTKFVSYQGALDLIKAVGERHMRGQFIQLMEPHFPDPVPPLEDPVESIHCTVIDGTCYMSVSDIIMVASAKSETQAGYAWHKLVPEIKQRILQFGTISTCGERRQRVITLQGALELIKLLPGNIAWSFQKCANDLMMQFFHNSAQSFVSWLLAAAEEVRDQPVIKYVYAAWSDCFPHLIKIGFTCNLHERMDKARTFSAPAPFKIVAHVPSLNVRRDERLTHAFFEDRRVEGEFFRVSKEEVADFFSKNILPVFEQECVLCTYYNVA